MKSENSDKHVEQPKVSIYTAAEFLGITTQAVFKQLKNKGIVVDKISNKGFITYDSAKALYNISFKRKKIAGQIVKGGTGKTTTIDNIASCANTYGAKVLLIDADPQGNLTDANGIDAENFPVLIDLIKDEIPVEDCVVRLANGLDLIPSRIENVILDNEIVNKRLPLDKLYKNILAPIESNYDFIFIDCPPTMGQAVAAATLYSDLILVPLNPDKFSAKGLKILKNEVENLNKTYHKKIAYKVFLNKFSGKTILSDKAIVSLLSDQELEGKVLSTTVQFSQEIPNTTDENRNVFNTLKKSVVREDYNRLTLELLEIYNDKTTKEEARVSAVERNVTLA